MVRLYITVFVLSFLSSIDKACQNLSRVDRYHFRKDTLDERPKTPSTKLIFASCTLYLNLRIRFVFGQTYFEYKKSYRSNVSCKVQTSFQISKSSRKAVIIYSPVWKCYLTKTIKQIDLGFNLIISYWK